MAFKWLSSTSAPKLRSIIHSSSLSNHPCLRQAAQQRKSCFPRNGFHTSQRRNVHPLVLVLMKPIGKVGAIISGRYMRKTWQTISPQRKAKIKEALWNARWKIGAAGGLLFTAATINFVAHIQETPVTKRKRFIAFTPDQFMKISRYELEAQLENHKPHTLPYNHPIYGKVVNIAQNIVNSNQDHEFFRTQRWTVIVVESEDQNAFVLPTGHIFVFTGLLRVADDDRLAIVLGHEMAHAFLSHGAEQVSFAAVLDWFIILVMAGIWAVMPSDGIALVTQWFYNKVVKILLDLPYSRKLEEEADYVGLKLAAKACYDVRESSAFWNLMDIRESLESEIPPPQFLSTHPSNKTRADTLDKLIPEAMDIRKFCNCPKLPSKDPRDEVLALRAEMEEERRIEAERKRLAEEEEAEKRKRALTPPVPKPHVGIAAAGLIDTRQGK